MTGVLWICFAISGAAGLALEMLWMRSAALVLGQTPSTTAMVLACYFAGLGVGATAARGVRRQPLRTYALLEWGAAAGALWSLAAFHLLASDAAQVWLSWTAHLGEIAVVALATMPATLCLGATLPALGQALATRQSVGREGGWLSAVNTLGGALGCALAGFGLPLIVGVNATYALTAAASAMAGTLALVVARRGVVAHTPPQAAGAIPPSHCRLRIVAAAAGALGLGLEVLWTRLYAQVLHNSVYSFTAVALVFLVALAAGAALAALLLRRVPAQALAAAALLAAAVSTIAGTWLFISWTDGLAYVGMRTGLAEYVLRIVWLAAATAGPTAIASGAVLPALWDMWGSDAAARPLGDLSAANVFGGLVGALATGFTALPTLGVRGTLLLAAVGYVILADLTSPARTRLRAIGYATLLAVTLADPLRAPLVHLTPGQDVLRAMDEGPGGIVTVVDSDGDLQLRLDNFYVLGGTASATNERRLGLVPLLLHPQPRRVAFIGLATGVTASAALALNVPEITVVELVPQVAVAARTFFAPWNAHLLEHPEVHLALDDGRRHLAASRDRFDVIVSDLFIPWHSGTGALYTRQMDEIVARRLAPGGLFCQWLPLYQLTREEFETIARTFLTVFPHATLWRADFYPDRPVVGLVGTLSPNGVDLTSIQRRMAQAPAWSRDPLLATPRGLVMLYAGDLTAARTLFANAPLNTDDRPYIEFTAPRLTRINAAGDKDWLTGESLAAFYDELATRTTDDTGSFLPTSAEVTDARRAGTALYRYALAATRHDDDDAARLEAQVRELVPEVVADGESSDPVASIADARRELAGLRSEEEQMRRRVEEMERRVDALSDTNRARP